eukprot:TRINITY_DN22388_c1_g2_i1.p1 TRINITY_DN22388_c1_g2~~TRINITY_DN22388_c1_g2_i1.p1  ORF type:complete len:124 (+),score=5.23 TRINITY_DN22388_c1_g2_i1:498-869(+)
MYVCMPRMRKVCDDTVHYAIDYAKSGDPSSQSSLLKLLDANKMVANLIVNTRPAPRKYNVLHQCAWHGSLETCKRLIEDYGADPLLLTSSGEKASEIATQRKSIRIYEGQARRCRTSQCKLCC